MSKNLMKFEQIVNEKGYLQYNRNNNLPAVARYAKIYEVSQDEYESLVKSAFGADFTKSDEGSMKRAWDKIQSDGNVKTMSEYVNDKKDFNFIKYVHDIKKQDAEINEEQKKIETTCNFNSYIENLKGKYTEKIKKNALKCQDIPSDSSFLSKIYDENDLVWMNDTAEVNDIHYEVKDIKSFSEKKCSLSNFNFVSINPLKNDERRDDKNVKKYKYMLLESDELPKNEQMMLLYDMIEFGVPIKTITFTGNKSYHALVKVDKCNSKEEWDDFVDEVFKRLNGLTSLDGKKTLFDEKCKNPSRLSRLPFAIRCDEKTEYEKKKQILMYIQEDEELLSKDAREMICGWCDRIIGKEDINHSTSSKENLKDEIDETELLSLFKNRENVIDIWNDGSKNHSLMKTPEYDKNGRITYSIIDKRWDSDKAFYSAMSQKLSDEYKIEASPKDIATMKIRYKEGRKWPFVGVRDAVRKDIVNTFIPGWLGKVIKDDKIPSELNEKLEMFLNNIFGDDIEARTWTLQWMREFMHSFDALTSPVFWGIQGNGKTMFTKAFGEAIGDWIKTPPKKDDIQFNAWQDHTVIIFEESSSGSKREGKDLGDLLKDWITEVEKTIEAKGKDPVKKMIKSCYLFNANISESVAPVFIEENDRRYTIIRNDNAKNLVDIWNEEDFKHWDSGEWPKQLMKWIYNLPKDKTVDVHRGLQSKWKQQIVNMNKPNLEIAIEQMIEMFNANNVKWKSCKEIFDIIKDEYGISASTRAIGNILVNLGYHSKPKKIMGEVKKVYVFNEDQGDTEESSIIDVL